MRLSDLLGLRVRTQGGDRLGCVHDVRAELTPRTLKVTGLVVGRLGVLERLGAPTSTARLRGHTVIAWKDIIRADRRGVVVRDGASDDDIAAFTSNGLAAWAVAVGAKALRRARKRRVGRES